MSVTTHQPNELKAQESVNKYEAKAFLKGQFHDAYGLIAIMISAWIVIVDAVLFARFASLETFLLMIVPPILIFAFAIAVFVDLWSHGFGH